MKIECRLLMFIGVFFFLGCEQEELTRKGYWTLENTKNEFRKIDITPGTSTNVKLKVPEAPYVYSFNVIVPKSIEDGLGNPLVLSLHGGVGGAGREAHTYTDCVAPALESINAFVISPNADKVQWYQGYNQDKIVQLLKMALEFWPIDSTRIVVTGYSDGGNGSWFFSEAYPKVFSAGIPMASSYNTDSSNGGGRNIQTPLYVIHGTGDELFPIDRTRDWVHQSIEAGSAIQFVEAANLSHYRPCDYLPYLEDAMTWLKEDVWK